jgi:hypothetical protein
MKILTSLTPAALLTMLALSPLAQASAPKSHGSGHASYRPAYSKPTTYSTYKKPTYHAPAYHAAKPATYVKPTYHVSKPTTYVKPAYHAPTYKGYVKPTYLAAKYYAPKYTNYVKQHGVKFSHGYYYSGKYHSHWAKKLWLPKYGTWCWYCPSTYVWYYWCGPKACYYPITYITQAPPVVATPETAVVPPGGEELPEVPPTEAENPAE